MASWRGSKITSSRNGPQHNKRFPAFGDGGGEWGVGRVVGDVLFAGLILTDNDTQEGTALAAVVVACCPEMPRAACGIAGI